LSNQTRSNGASFLYYSVIYIQAQTPPFVPNGRRLVVEIAFLFCNIHLSIAENLYFIMVSEFVVMDTRTNLFSIELEFSCSFGKRFLLL